MRLSAAGMTPCLRIARAPSLAPSAIPQPCLLLACLCAQGLPPGIHRFKYLVDGCWVIDLAAHTEADARGNINNVSRLR